MTDSTPPVAAASTATATVFAAAPLLRVRNLVKHFPIRGGVFSRTIASVKAVQDVSFDMRSGETLGLVGESGCGKSTLGRALLLLEDPSAGEIHFEGTDIVKASRREVFRLRREMQMVFQDPDSSLNPRMTIGDIVREPLQVHRMGRRKEQTEKAAELLESVGLTADMMKRYPHEFSGGQRQRVGIARALALNPKIIIADEPVSALDVSVQAQVLNLMVSLQKKFKLTYLFISHALSVVEYISDTIAIMYLGRIVEKGPRDAVFAEPLHPYTRALMEAIPVPDPRKRKAAPPVRGETPSAVNPPPGCAFHPRCPYKIEACTQAVPPLEALEGGRPDHVAACIRKQEI